MSIRNYVWTCTEEISDHLSERWRLSTIELLIFIKVYNKYKLKYFIQIQTLVYLIGSLLILGSTLIIFLNIVFPTCLLSNKYK